MYAHKSYCHAELATQVYSALPLSTSRIAKLLHIILPQDIPVSLDIDSPMHPEESVVYFYISVVYFPGHPRIYVHACTYISGHPQLGQVKAILDTSGAQVWAIRPGEPHCDIQPGLLACCPANTGQ